MKLALMVMLIGIGVGVAEDAKTARWDFEDATVGKLPAGWTSTKTGKDEGTKWEVVEDKSAPKGSKVLAQIGESPGATYNLCIADKTSFKEVEISVAFKSVKGDGDQGGGVIWRCADANNYYIARYNPLEANFRVYKVVAGKRVQLASKDKLALKPGWHTLSVRMQGDAIECSLNGKKELDAKDDTLKYPGRIGLWTKADAHTYFDDLQVKELAK
jgi:hypothetical protein